MPEHLFMDAVRFCHFVGLALGIGAGCFADYSIIRNLNAKITNTDISNLEIVHGIVWTGLLLLWASGLWLLYARTGFVIEEFTPKLIIKLLVVSILTLNAVLLGVIAMPTLRKNVNRSFFAFSLSDKLNLGILAGISTCSWFSGLTLGIFTALKPADFSFMLPAFGMVYLTALAGALLFSTMMHVLWERRIEKSKLHLTERNADMNICFDETVTRPGERTFSHLLRVNKQL
ncbi:MAG: hypothetical protein AAGA53_08555 [Pseudomonadota bacterium]